MLYRLSAILFFAAILITSCTKENIDTVVPEEPVYNPDTTVVNNAVTGLRASSPDGLDIECITLLYPIEFTLLSGDVITVTSAEEFEAALLETGEQQIIDFVYPVEIINGDGEEESVEDLFALGTAFASCIPTDGWGEDDGDHDLLPAFLFSDLCFDLVYPVDLQDIDGNLYTANNEQELVDLIAEIVELFFVMPIDVTDEEGEVQTIESSAQFFEFSP